MATFKKLKDKFATKEQAKRQDVLVWNKEFWKACKWFFEKGKKSLRQERDAAYAAYDNAKDDIKDLREELEQMRSIFSRCYWQPIYELTEEHGTVLGRCGNEFSLVKAVHNFEDDVELSIISVETRETFNAREFMAIPLNNRTEVEVSYSVKGLVLGVTWEGREGVYPLDTITQGEATSSIENILACVQDALNNQCLTGTGDFSKQLGAILVITKSTTINVNDKPFVNTEVSREFIGDLTAEQMEELDNAMDW